MENRKSEHGEVTSQQLDRLFELFVACREMEAQDRSAWLEKACNGDGTLQRQVEELLREDASADGFLSQPMRLLTEALTLTVKEGQHYGRYRIVGPLGRGGMGQVWEAHDEELDRRVALKFMQLGLPVNQLTIEARMASGLHHPGIVMVFDVIEWQGTPILVMELVVGTALSRFRDGHLRREQLLSIAAQTTSTLAAAHTRGILHGDIKPDNILLREDGITKVLDFGLARKVAERVPAAGVAGTPLYMSPEQARGETIDIASDVYSLGLVLYELAAGKHPFGCQTLAEIGQRNNRPARVAAGESHVPEAVSRLIDRMLEPEPTRRVSMQEVAETLQKLEQGPGFSYTWRWIAGIAATVCAVVLAIGWWAYGGVIPVLKRSLSPEANLVRLTSRPLASQPGIESSPSMSPDGRWLSCLYQVDPSDRPQLQVHALRDGGRQVTIDTGELTVEGMAAWSPDSGEIAFSAKEGSHVHGIWRVARTGGTPRRIASCRERVGGGCEVDWSPDGKTLVIADYWSGHSELYLLELETGRRRELLLQEGGSITRPRFSPDGKWIGYVRRTSLSFEDLTVISSAGGNPRHIGKSAWFDRGFTWSPDSQSLLGYWYRGNEKPHLWKFPLSGGQGEQLSSIEATREFELTGSRVKGPLAWVRRMSENSLWRMPVSSHTGSPKILTNSAAIDVDAEWSHDGRMVFRSDRSGGLELWIARADGSEAWQATHLRGPFVGDAHWSPDGRWIAFTSHIAGNPEIYLIQCNPGESSCDTPRRLTSNTASDANPTWSNDGQWIYFSSSRSGKFEVWRLRSDGRGEAQQVTWKGGYIARESSDGKWLYYSKLSGSVGFWRTPLPLQGQEQPEVPVFMDVPFRAGATWALGKNELFFYPAFETPSVQFPPVRAVNLHTGTWRDLAVGNVRLDRGLSLSTDERWLLRSQIDRALTLIMIGE